MNREVTVSELREHVDDVLRSVREGDTITIVENESPLAEIVPRVSPPRIAGRLGDYRPTPLPEPIDFDPLELLIQDRQKDRNR